DHPRSGHDVSAGDIPGIPDRHGAVVVAPEDVVPPVEGRAELTGVGDMAAIRDHSGARHDVGAADRGLVPDRDRAVVVAPQDVGVPVAVEIARSGDVPGVRNYARAGKDVRLADVAVIPDRGRAVVVAPEDVALAGAVEIGLALDMP